MPGTILSYCYVTMVKCIHSLEKILDMASCKAYSGLKSNIFTDLCVYNILVSVLFC